MQNDIFDLIKKTCESNNKFFLKKAFKFQNINFNFLLDLLNSDEYLARVKFHIENDVALVNHNSIFSHTFQIDNTEKNEFIFNFTNNLKNNLTEYDFKTHHLFVSFQKSMGTTHIDQETVFITGLYGKTIYKVGKNEQFIVEPGDILIIPKGIVHVACSLGPRIILSSYITKKDK